MGREMVSMGYFTSSNLWCGSNRWITWKYLVSQPCKKLVELIVVLNLKYYGQIGTQAKAPGCATCHWTQAKVPG